MIRHHQVYARPPGRATRRLGDLSIFQLQQQINNAEIAQANAESSGDGAAAAAANAQANVLHAQMAAIYANATPPDKVAQVTAVLQATAPTAPTIAPPPPPPPPPPAPSPVVNLQFTGDGFGYGGTPPPNFTLPPVQRPTVQSSGAPIPPKAQQSTVPAAMVSSLNIPGFNFSSIPLWAWLSAGAGALYFFTKK